MTPTNAPLQQASGDAPVADLLARRAQLQAWLARLDQVAGDVAAHVSERVRADYERRLEAIVSDLSAHVETIRADLELLRERLQAAGQRHEAATDALEEVRLRFLIGELAENEWEARRSELEGEVADTAAAREEAAAEAERLEELLAQIDSAPAAPAPFLTISELVAEEGPAPEVVAEREVPEELGGPPRPTTGPEEAYPGEAPRIAADGAARADEDVAVAAGEEEDEDVRDLAFLEELDRAIAATGPDASDEALPELETRPQPGVKCPDCGYTNDSTAWYCGVCGVDLA